ncbi:MAG: hypothetical protein R3C53_06845 [Pirellulaceae bacterium]
MKKMNAITFKQTGHVLGIVTRSSQPDTPVTAAEVAAGGYRLRFFEDITGDFIMLEIPEDEVGITLVDYDTRVLYQPHLYIVVDGLVEEKPSIALPSVTRTATHLTVTLPAPVSESVAVWCQISGENLPDPIVRSISIMGTSEHPTSSASVPQRLDITQAVQVAVFAPGYALQVLDL